MNEERSMEAGVQPLDRIMADRSLKNHDLVAAMPPGYINHKQVQKARKGRRLTANMQNKVLEALNACSDPDRYELNDLFNYRGNKSR